MSRHTLTANDIQYIAFYLQEKDPNSGSITPYTLATASSIVFRMSEYGSTVNTIEATMETLASPSNTLGYCRVLATIPNPGTFTSEVEVFDGAQRLTWKGPVFLIESELG